MWKSASSVGISLTTLESRGDLTYRVTATAVIVYPLGHLEGTERKLMSIDLSDAIKKWAIDCLPYDRNDPTLCAELASKDVRELLIIYHNWMARHVYPTPRQILKSKAYNANPIVAQRKDDLDALISKIEAGIDLRPHLSTRVETVIEPANKKLSRRRDLDLMLIEWDVHHLHVSQELQPNGFVKRDDPLLFAVFHQKEAYLLDVMAHGDFNRDHILKLMADEWPDAELVYQIKGSPGQEVIGLAVNYTEEERDRLRKAGINTLVEIDGRVFKPAGGMTAAGTSIRASMAADEVVKSVAKLERSLNDNHEKFEKLARDHGVTWPENPTFEFGILEPHGLGFKELSTNFCLQVA